MVILHIDSHTFSTVTNRLTAAAQLCYTVPYEQTRRLRAGSKGPDVRKVRAPQGRNSC